VRQDGDDPWRLLCGGDVDRGDPRMRLCGTVETRKGLVREVKIVSILTLSGHETDVFRPFHRLSDAEFHL
jgi:hypothetical protein